ncbi:FtsK/SpoIIIE domain-containing protein [Arcanobacterium bovis]|uniref:FHA domain-containing protein n=1 Tax=Arcanobacterium bovis TaxID=2529275 RepID=A0A4Q9V1C9_9ACTO|nr:FtsK/SpoIIIE domain-containing protein [Arcanobacterium bovis]TBW22865.1 FHA domain-containing protein [Arcanobacterium bovis]
MRVVISQAGARKTFDLANTCESTTLGEVIDNAGLDLRAWNEFWVDDSCCESDTPITSIPLLDGSTISDVRLHQAPSHNSWTLVVTSGTQTTERYELSPNEVFRIGRSPDVDLTLVSPSVSWSHCYVTVEQEGLRFRDDNSSNGTYVDGVKVDDDGGIVATDQSVITIGGTCLRVQHGENTDIVHYLRSKKIQDGVSTIPFNRPPRTVVTHERIELELPVRNEAPKANRFSWISVLAPLVMAAGMVVVMGSVRYALVALLSPVMAVASWWEQKRRANAGASSEEDRFEKSIADFASEVQDQVMLERQYLRSRIPDPAKCMDNCTLPTVNLWERRTNSEDYWSAHLGTADIAYDVPISRTSSRSKIDENVQDVIDRSKIQAAPVEVDFKAGVVGIWGNREQCLAIARSLLCQQVSHCGPADMSLGVFTSKAHSDLWRWTAWLPHLRQPGTNPNNIWLGLETTKSQELLRSLRDMLEGMSVPSLMLVIDAQELTEGRDCPARDIFTAEMERGISSKKQKMITGIVIADSAEQLPSVCATVINAQSDSEATLVVPAQSKVVNSIICGEITIDVAHRWAQSIARFDDPEAKNVGSTLPTLTHLLPLLGLQERLDANSILEKWRRKTSYRTPIGMSQDGIYWLDLVRDGPHGLVGGTTGSGKSEFLRSLVAGLAAQVDPEHLTFILIDFKGGAAFARCDELPHTIGTISNLDAQLANRALRALEAEIVYRQRKFAEAGNGIDNLDAYLGTNPSEPMPRLLLVVDEFAQLAKEFPDVLSSLVSIAAVGRTLGIHMILATQRPAGVVNDDILANTNMRVALRVQSKEDSSGVISVPYAASIGRDQRGRAFVKLGEEEITPIQTALVTGYSTTSRSAELIVHEAELGTAPKIQMSVVRDSDEPSDLDRLIKAIVAANDEAGFAPARKVWPDPLKEVIPLVLDLKDDTIEIPKVAPESGSVIFVSLSDDPTNQRQYQSGWDLNRGNLILAGIPGSGTTSSLASIALSAAVTHSPENLDLMILDFGTRGLEQLSNLPHCIGYVPGDSSARERQERLLKYLAKEYDKRLRETTEKHTKIIVLIDGLATMRDEFDDFEALQLMDSFYQIWAKGPDVGIHCVASTTRIKAIPSQIDEVTTQKWLFRLADAYDYTYAGIGKDDIPASVPGRYVDAISKNQAHVALPTGGVDEALRQIQSAFPYGSKASVIVELPQLVAPHDLPCITDIGGDKWQIGVGLRESDISPCYVDLYDGEHLLVSGPARSGKSTVLRGLISKIRQDASERGEDIAVFGLVTRRSPLAKYDEIFDQLHFHDDASSVSAMASVSRVPTFIVVDDATALVDSDQAITNLLQINNPQVKLIVAARNDDLRSAYGHWTSIVRKSRCGILLQPNIDFDGDLLGVTLPRKSPVAMSVARGYMCQGGQASLIQALSLPLEEDRV